TREQNKLSNLDGTISEQTKVHKQLQSQVRVIEKHIADIGKDKEVQLEGASKVTNELQTKQAAHNEVLEQIEALRKEMDQSTNAVTSLHEELQQLREEKHRLQVRQTELATRKEGLAREQEVIRESASSAIDKSAELKGLVQQMEHKYEDAQAVVIGIERSIR